MKCDICGKKEYLPFKCKYCGGTFCIEHRLPEKHNCVGFKKDDYWNVPVKVKKEDKKSKIKVTLPDIKFPQPKKGLAAYGYNNLVLAFCTILFFTSIVFRNIDYYLAFHPVRFVIMPWQILSSVFLHVSFDHYLVNMIVLLFFGSELERRVGSKNYLKIFILSGLAGNAAYLVYAYSTGNLYPALGASASILGVMGTLAVIAPEIRVLLFFFIPMSIRVAILLFAAWDLLMLPYSSIDNIAHIAHLAGLLVGLYYGKRLKILRR
ncbi:rhomboid family intramembrane serine protease [Archaeoglobales archaeon]|nr:MAG: rhomboid family intramembrane serine protease [Archaeoglobales archaeon]